MTAKSKREFWLIVAVITAFLAMFLFVVVAVDGYFRVRSMLAGGALPSMQNILNDFSDRLGYGLFLGALGITSWISYKKYTKWAGLESEDEE